ncbi:MAG: DUF2065 family protein [Pseudomonadota bacterium]
MGDLLAALALVAVIEGLTMIAFAGSFPELLAMLERMGPSQRRWLGLVLVAGGTAAYLVIRGAT